MPIPERNEVTDAGDITAIVQNDKCVQNIIKTCCSGDFYLIGNLWSQALKKGLVGADMLIPVVNAAGPIETAPKKPPPMKYKELPIYESPHYDYKDFLADKEKCPKYKVKIAHEYLYPSVKKWRKEWTESLHGMKKELALMKSEVCEEICKKCKEFVKYMRSPDNLRVRQGAVAFGSLAGYYIGSGRSLSRRLFFATLGGLATGALCFPKETDQIFRDVSFGIAKVVIDAYNLSCNKQLSMRERLPCPDELPTTPEPLQSKNQCPVK